MRLQTRFSLAVGAVAVAATVLPMALLYLLVVSGLVEAAYIAGRVDARQTEGGIPTGAFVSGTRPAGRLSDPSDAAADGLPDGRFPAVAYDPQSGLWNTRIASEIPRVVFTSPALRFRIDLPAWLALGSLPAIGLLTGILLGILMSRGVTRPVARLAEAARSIGRRNLACRVETGGPRELQDLARSFNRMADELERAERIRRNLAADIAHELRTPLAVLDGNLRALLDGIRAPGGEEIARLYGQVRHLSRLADDLNELSLAEAHELALNRSETDLARLARETAAHFEPTARERGIRLSCKAEEGPPHPSLDEHRIRQVLHNLLANALRHTPRGGTVTLECGRTADGRALRIAVADTGMGIAAGELERVFDRFYRAEAPAGGDRGGSGLGLAIVKALVEAHAGTVCAESGGKGRGSTFTVMLPAGTKSPIRRSTTS